MKLENYCQGGLSGKHCNRERRKYAKDILPVGPVLECGDCNHTYCDRTSYGMGSKCSGLRSGAVSAFRRLHRIACSLLVHAARI